MSPASGSWLSTRIVVSTRRGIGFGPYLGALDVALLAGIDFEPVADVHEERHLDHRARLERSRLRDVADRVALDARLRVGHLEHDRGGQIDARRVAPDEHHLHA